jgi:hypothetical protein
LTIKSARSGVSGEHWIRVQLRARRMTGWLCGNVAEYEILPTVFTVNEAGERMGKA